MATTDKSIDHLNMLLRGELSAVETYDQAMEKIGDAAFSELSECRESHAQRVELLSQAVRSRGGEPATGSGVWGAFAQAMEGGAKMLGRDTAIAALEEGEDRGLADYRSVLDESDLDRPSRRLIEEELLPEQLRTHGRMSALTHSGSRNRR